MFSGRRDFRWIMPTTRGCQPEVWQRHIEDCATPQVAVLGAKSPSASMSHVANKKGGHLARLLLLATY